MQSKKLLTESATIIFNEINIGREKLRLHENIDKYAEILKMAEMNYENAKNGLMVLQKNPDLYFRYNHIFDLKF